MRAATQESEKNTAFQKKRSAASHFCEDNVKSNFTPLTYVKTGKSNTLIRLDEIKYELTYLLN